MGEHVGFWEWVVWSFLKDVQILMLFGSVIVDVRLVFGPAAVAPMHGVHRVAAVMLLSDGSYQSAVAPGNRGHVPVVNHFLVGTTRRNVVEVVATGPPNPIYRKRCAVRAAMQVGWVLKHTQKMGDCGLDAMSYNAGMVRTPSTWQAIRRDLSKFMLENMNKTEWQESFVCCQDVPGSNRNPKLQFCSVWIDCYNRFTAQAGVIMFRSHKLVARPPPHRRVDPDRRFFISIVFVACPPR